MRLSHTLDTGTIVTGATWPNFDAVVAGLVHRLVEVGHLPVHLEVPAVKAICERERMASTAMVDIGVSIPHSRLEGLEQVTTGLAVSPSAIYGASSGTPISIVALVLSPPTLIGEHLNLLSAISLLLHSGAIRRSLHEADTPERVLELIRTHESR